MQTLEIFEPKYKTNCCLIAKYKVDKIQTDFLVVFTKAFDLLDKKFLVKYSDCLNSDIVSNGKIDCYAVPMEKLIEMSQEKIDEMDNKLNPKKETSNNKKVKFTRKEIIQKYTNKILEGIDFALDNKNNLRICSEIVNYINIQQPILEDLAECNLKDIIIKLFGDDSEQVHNFDEFNALNKERLLF